MKIAQVCPYDLSLYGGVQKHVLLLQQKLLSLGHQAFIIAPSPRKKIKITQAKYFGYPIPIPFNKSMTCLTVLDQETNGKLEKFLEKEKFEVICLHEPAAPFLNWQVLGFSRSLNIGWFHSTLASNSFPYNLVSFSVELLSLWLKEKLQGFIAVSPSAKKSWQSIFKNQGIVLPIGVDAAFFSNKSERVPKSEFLNILFVGRLDERKGLLDALHALKIVTKFRKAKLWIVGEGPEKRKGQELIEKLELKDEVVFLGEVTDKKLPCFYQSADVFCAPSIGGESLGMVLLEAMAAGLPIVAYSNAGYKFTLSGYPYKKGLVKVEAWQDLARSILELGEKPSLKRQIKDWEKKKIKEFQYDKIALRFLEYAQSL